MEQFMTEALKLAKIAFEMGEVPVGAVVVKDKKIIGCGLNRREIDNNPLAHAEILAINEASKTLGSWRLEGCTLYVTLEPCPMCMGAVINSRIDKVVFGAYDFKAGACGSVTDLNAFSFNHKPEIWGGICEQPCKNILSEFFEKLRKNK